MKNKTKFKQAKVIELKPRSTNVATSKNNVILHVEDQLIQIIDKINIHFEPSEVIKNKQ